MRPYFIVLVSVLGLMPVAARAQTDQVPFRLVPVYAGGPIAIDGAALGGRQSTGMLQATLRFQAGLTCLNVHNTDARTATLVRYAFAYFDATGKRVGGESFSRKASFTTGTPMKGYETYGTVHQEGCVPIHYPKEGIAADIFFVDHVEFADGTEWNAADVHLPENAGTAFTPRARPAPPRAISGNVIELGPVVVGGIASCAAAPNLGNVTTPTFQGSLAMKYDPDRSVVLEATTDRADTSGFHVVSSTVCRSATDATRTASAQALLAGSVIPLGSRAVFVYFPYINTTARCTAPARVMVGVRMDYVAPHTFEQTPGPGAYVSNISVSVDANGAAHDPVTKNSSGRPELDAAALKAVLANHYWPAVRDGTPIAGVADVSFGWTFDAARMVDGKTSISSRLFESETPPAPDC